MIVYLGIGGAAITVILFFLDKDNDSEETTNTSIISSLFETVKFTKNPKLLLMIFITIFSGMEQAFVYGDISSVSYLIYTEIVSFICNYLPQ